MQNPNSQEEPLLVGVPEAVRRLGGGRDWVYELIRAGQLPVVRVGRRILVPVAALAAFVQREATTEAPGSDGLAAGPPHDEGATTGTEVIGPFDLDGEGDRLHPVSRLQRSTRAGHRERAEEANPVGEET